MKEYPAKTEEEETLFRQTLIEENKLSFEAMKQLTTLSTGSLVLMVTFLERLFGNNREWTGLLAVTLISLVLSIILAVSTMVQTTNLLTTFTVKRNDYTFKMRLTKGIMASSFVVFVMGILSLAIFALKNLF